MINRRSFLQQTSIISAGMMLMPDLLTAKTNRQYGLQLFAFRETLPKEVNSIIPKIAQAGYKQVEPFGYSKKNGFWGLTASEFKKLLDDNGLTVPSAHYSLDLFLSSGDTAQVEEAIEAAKILGQKYIVLPYLPEQYRNSADAMNAVVDKINIAADKIQQAGLKMAYHNHDFEFKNIGGQRLFDLLLNNTSSKQLDFEMDIYWVIRSGEDPLKWLQDHPNRFKLVHIKDMEKANPALNTEIGSGNIDYKTILKKIRSAGVKYYIVEQENFKMDQFLSIEKSINYLKQIS
ncbi:sugar phosphate isomerase/epimerase [Mucilaginibacter sp. HC2]|uniref:sugar phosphate isomerase/epimerase family protein n=1 Tax=Mucilaginibacter inviolabilis TaxID=2714892 RepID=UPI00140B6968|nr:sugar phosphate isomerase/epimerase [Mucilaginibacter inviolabilis]NHA02419.1 sugar phosphate isomerase/epimerase [Mucilaginibacter inviolabilis]